MITFSKLEKLGRLGNQLFQIAATVSYAKDNQKDPVFKTWSYSKYFNVPNSFFTDEQISPDTRYNEISSLNYNEIPLYRENYGILDLNGYFQSEKYFIQNKQIIMDMFKTEKTESDFGFIHIRRGDYLQSQHYHPVQPIDYYIDGMNEMGMKYYYCFSDDIKWCKENISDHRVMFVENTSEIDDLRLMMRCSGAIIANSSFSWWGAYLGNHNNVIIPNNWFGPGYPGYRIEDKCCEGWKIR